MIEEESTSEIAEKDAQARLNVGIKPGDKCETCKINDATQQILGDDCKKWHVCDACLKKYWKIDMNSKESREWRERKKRENAEILIKINAKFVNEHGNEISPQTFHQMIEDTKKEIDSTIMKFKTHDRQKRQEWIEQNYKILQTMMSDEDIAKMLE